MLASTLIRQFVSSSRYLALYCGTYTPSIRQADGSFVTGAPYTPATLPETAVVPPSRGHAQAMAKTLQEWAEKLDSAGIQVHQEGALARFLGAQGSPLFGRNPGAVGAREKTLKFYHACLDGAVALARCNSFSIPGAPFQGAAIATHEAVAAAKAFRDASVGLAEMETAVASGRPELQVELEKLRNGIGRHVAMHQSAAAEAVGCWGKALGPWIQQVSDPGSLKAGLLYYGLEVVAGSPLLPFLVGNLDPQHGGGVYGFGIPLPQKPVAACDAARDLVLAGVRLPEAARYVTDRLDPDALVAGMILSGRIPAPLLSSGYLTRKIELLARMDSGAPREGGWVPGRMLPQSVADCPIWGAVAALCLQYVRGVGSLEELEGAVMAVLMEPEDTSYPVESNILKKAREGARRSWEQAEGLRFSVDSGIALGVDLPVSSGTWAKAYSLAPVGILVMDDPKNPGNRKYSIGVARDVGQKGPKLIQAVARALNELEPGWGGPNGGTILGSPFRGGSGLPVTTVQDIVVDCARSLGLLPGAGKSPTPALR